MSFEINYLGGCMSWCSCGKMAKTALSFFKTFSLISLCFESANVSAIPTIQRKTAIGIAKNATPLLRRRIKQHFSYSAYNASYYAAAYDADMPRNEPAQRLCSVWFRYSAKFFFEAFSKN
jgi:hypothetical protein